MSPPFFSRIPTMVSIVFVIVSICVYGGYALTSGSTTNANLTIYDTTDTSNGYSNITLFFYANFTNSTSTPLNQTLGAASCNVSYNFSGAFSTFASMNYNGSSLLWQHNSSFNYKGNHQFNVSCISDYGNITLIDTFTILNTEPAISRDQGGTYIDFDGNKVNNDYLQCNEDTLCTYNFSANVTEVDFNDVLAYNYTASNTTLTNFTLGGTTGLLQINSTSNESSGSRQIELSVRDSEGVLHSAFLRVNITSVNDAPTFANLINQSFNMTQPFEYIITASDEEGHYPFSFNITFLSCGTVEWSDRNSTNCALFNSSQYSFNVSNGTINISFTPTRNDVGWYLINFTVKDSGTLAPVNASRSMIANFTVLNLNAPPYFRNLCEVRNATQGLSFLCRVNVSDIDETSNLTIASNESWFLGTTIAAVNLSTSYNASVLVNFTPTNTEVGNWSINISAFDTGVPRQGNSSIISFYVANVNDSVLLRQINNITTYVTNNYTLYINASDDDSLIPDKTVYNESIRFSSNHSNVTITFLQAISGTNITSAVISFVPSYLGVGNHTINFTAQDANNYSRSSILFTIAVLGNSAPVWNVSTLTNISLNEGSSLSLNLSLNVSDADGTTLNFSYLNDSAFPSFALNATTGMLVFTPVDADVGQHLVTINATDGITSAALLFNFTVNNTPDTPLAVSPLEGSNATINSSTSNINTTEDLRVQLTLWVDDDDLKIPLAQKGFYNESILVHNLTIVGNNPFLFNFSVTANFPTDNFPNRTQFRAIFTPNKSDVGTYNISVNISDQTNRTSSISFTLTIASTEHAPSIGTIGNITSSIIETLFIDVNSTDAEDLNDSAVGSNLTYTIKNLTTGGEFLTINRSSGIINITFNQSHAGTWTFNVTVNDSLGLSSSQLFTLTVYDYPKILLPLTSTSFSFAENISSLLNLTVNHTVGSVLNYSLYISNVLRNQTTGYGNGSAFLWNFTANLTDETTCSGNVTLMLNVSNERLSNITSWNVSIQHTNSPLMLSNSIGGSSQRVSGQASASLTLSDYFSDIDASDGCHNQSIGFSFSLLNTTSGSISVTVVNWTNATSPSITFLASSDSSANYSVLAFEYNTTLTSTQLRNVSSNNFSVVLSPPAASSSSSSSSSGGGGASTVVTKLVSFKIILPDPLSVSRRGRITLPITVVNNGQQELIGLRFFSLVSQDGFLTSSIQGSFSQSYLPSLSKGESQNISLELALNTDRLGLYEIHINATSDSPAYSDWGKIYLEVKEGRQIDEKIFFTEDLIAQNPACAEIKEIIEEAKVFLAAGNTVAAERKIAQAIEGCQAAISHSSLSPQALDSFMQPQKIFSWVGIATFFAVIGGFIYHLYSRIRLKRVSRQWETEQI